MTSSWRPPLSLALLALLGATGCATNLANLKTAEALEKGKVRVSGEFGVFVPAGSLARLAVASAKQAARLTQVEDGSAPAPTPEEEQEIFATATSIALFPPGTATNLQLRYGVSDGFDMGLRLSTISQRIDGRLKLYEKEQGGPTRRSFHLALIAGAERQGFSGFLWDYLKKAFDLLEFIGIEKPRRFDFDLSLLASWNFAGIVRPYFGLVYRLGWFQLPEILTINLPGEPPIVKKENLDSFIHFFGFTAGTAVGYKWIWAFLELDAHYLVSNPTIAGTKTKLGGVTLFPAIGVALRFP